jgi:hypothetical protein
MTHNSHWFTQGPTVQSEEHSIDLEREISRSLSVCMYVSRSQNREPTIRAQVVTQETEAA